MCDFPCGRSRLHASAWQPIDLDVLLLQCIFSLWQGYACHKQIAVCFNLFSWRHCAIESQIIQFKAGFSASRSGYSSQVLGAAPVGAASQSLQHGNNGSRCRNDNVNHCISFLLNFLNTHLFCQGKDEDCGEQRLWDKAEAPFMATKLSLHSSLSAACTAAPQLQGAYSLQDHSQAPFCVLG